MTTSHYSSHGWKKSKGSALRFLKRFKLSKTAWKNVFLGLIALAVAGSIGILGLFAYFSSNLPDPNSLTERSIPQSTKIYDRTGEHLLYEIHGEENRTLVKLQEGFCKDDTELQTDPNGIPLLLQKAVIAAEDHKFCSHYGFSITGILRAVIFGGSRGGGSTLTQQLVSNALIAKEHTIQRKIKELILSIELERRYSKDEILQIYFNEIGYGSTYYGVQTASQKYYGKNVNELSLGQIATLAGLPQRPTTLLNDPDLLKERRDWILDQMVELGFISQEDANGAKTEDDSISLDIANNGIDAPHFVFYVRDQLEQKYGQRQVEEGGLKVITTLDYDKQKIAEEEVTNGVDARGETYQFTNASLVAIDPKTGQVLAMVGSKDFFDKDIDGQVNVALRPRQPGSSFKPIVYTKAFTMGYTPNTILWDVNTTFPTASGPYEPHDYDLKQRGPIRVREALQGSLNIPAVEMLYMVGVGNALDFATELGYSTFEDRSNFGLAIVLGGAEVKLLDHTNAYATFADDGVYHAPVSVLKVEDSSGKTLEEWKENDGKRVIESNIAHMISNVLSDNGARSYIFGPNSYVQLGNRPVAAKTGTTNDYHDAWTLGYTPSLAAGVWVGNNNNDEMKRGADGSIVAAPIWNAFMKRALENTPIEPFPAPSIPTTGKAILDGHLPATTVVVDKVSGKLATEYTPPQDRETRTYAEYHSLLYYCDRANPLGDPPADPTQDPYFVPWESAIAAWLGVRETETGIVVTSEKPPTESDDVHVPENFPTVTITDPNEGTEVGERTVSIEATASAARGVARMEFYIDGYFLGSDTSYPYRFTATIPNTISSGYHTLKAVAYDDVDNSGSDTVGVRITSEPAAASFDIIDPHNGQTIERTADTYNVTVSLQNPTAYGSVSLYVQEIGHSGYTLVGTKENPDSPFVQFVWTLPASGDWVLSATANPSTSGETLQSAGIVVHVIAPAGAAPPAIAPDSTEDTNAEGADSVVPLPALDPFAQPSQS